MGNSRSVRVKGMKFPSYLMLEPSRPPLTPQAFRYHLLLRMPCIGQLVSASQRPWTALHTFKRFAVSQAISPSLIYLIELSFQEGVAFPRRTATMYSTNRKVDPSVQKYQGFGGFPGPVALAKKLFKRSAPTTFRKLERKMTMPYTETLEAKKVPWLKFDGLVVGRNSAFRTETLTDEQIENIGGVEYRALRLLSYLIPIVCVVLQR